MREVSVYFCSAERKSPCLFPIRGKVHGHPVPSSSVALLREWKNPITLQTTLAASNDTPAWPITSLSADPRWQTPTLCVLGTINRPDAYLEMIRYHCVRKQGLIGLKKRLKNVKKRKRAPFDCCSQTSQHSRCWDKIERFSLTNLDCSQTVKWKLR